MQLRNISSFLAIARAGSLTKAAKMMGISQPALSKQIDFLENELGCHLYVRGRHDFTLTFAGEIFGNEAEKLLNIVEIAVRRAQTIGKGLKGYLRIGFASTAVITGFLPNLVSAFRLLEPGYEVVMANKGTDRQVEQLKENSLDIAILRLPLTDQPEDLIVRPLMMEKNMLLVPGDHELAASGSVIPSQLDGRDMVAYARSKCRAFSELLHRYFVSQSVTVRTSYEINDMFSLCSMVSSGFGPAVAPASTRNYNLKNIKYYDLPDLPPSVIGIAMRAGEERDFIRRFFDLAVTSAPRFQGKTA